MAGPRPPPPNGQPPNLVRPPPPPQLRRSDSRPLMQVPGQNPQQQQQQSQPPRPQVPPQQQQQQQFGNIQGPRPTGPLPPQQQFAQPRPQNPQAGPVLRGGPPQTQQPPQLGQPPLNRPPIPNPQQPPLTNRPPFIRPQGGVPPSVLPGQQQYRPPAPVQRPMGDQPNLFKSQNSFERSQMSADGLASKTNLSRPNSVMSTNDDDDDVIMGRSVSSAQGSIHRTPSDLQNKPQIQRSDSKLSIPSRPPSANDHLPKSPSPENQKPPFDYKPQSENNLPKIPETFSKNLYDSNTMPPRPPSVTFKDNIVRQSNSPEPTTYGGAGKYPNQPSSGLNAKSPISLNAMMNDENNVYKTTDRITTPTSEKFRTQSPYIPNPERPTNLINGEQKLRSSLKFSKIYFIQLFIDLIKIFSKVFKNESKYTYYEFKIYLLRKQF